MESEELGVSSEELRQQVSALREQIGRLQVEREQLKQTYDKALERANREAKAAGVEWLRRAKDLCQPCVHAIQCIMAIDAEIVELSRSGPRT